MLMKAPSLYPSWYEEWDLQIRNYALKHRIHYLNAIDYIPEIGLDFQHDSYDGGLHMNIYGAEKLSDFLGKDLIKNYALPDHRGEEVLQKIWAEKVEYYEKAREEQEREFSEYGYLKQFSDEP